MKNIAFVLLSSFLIAFSMSFAPAPSTADGPWVLLGSKMVDFVADHDIIPVTVKDGDFKAVKVKVLRAPIDMNNLKVNFGNGESQNIVIGHVIKAGGETRTFDLEGHNRVIRDIVLNYKSMPRANKKAMVQVWGMK